MWAKVDAEFEACSLAMLCEAPEDQEEIQKMYGECYEGYERCVADLIAQIDRPDLRPPGPQTSQGGCRLPPCDIEVFAGDYVRWPTFRDLFTAIYINNPRLSPVEKLYHLTTKTRGDPKAIVEKSPLTNDGFEAAWSALRSRYENNRLLVTNQINILLLLPRVGSETSRALKELQSTIQGVLTALAHSKVCTDNWDSILVTICASKLPKLTRALWEASVTDKKEMPPWTEIDSFLTQRYLTLEAMESDPSQARSDPHQQPSKGSQNPQSSGSHANPFRSQGSPPPRNFHSFKTHINPKQCDLCSKENHPVRLCPHFLQMDVEARSSCIKTKQLCLNCFARGHQLRECTSAHNCFTCGARHHTLLHRGTPASSESSTSAQISNSSDAQPTVQNYFTSGTRPVLLGTAIINICHLGTNFRARALIDSGSEATFITERLFNIIKLPFRLIQAQVSGLSQSVAAQSKKLCHFSIRSPTKPGLQLKAAAYVLPELAGNLPSYPIPLSALRDLPNLPLADPTFYESSQIDVLIGADILPSILLSGSQTDICGSLLGQETIFGWLLTGPVPSAPPNRIASFSTQVSNVLDAPLDKLLTKFWEVEDLPTKLVGESDSYCESNFLQTTTRATSGKYMVTLPFRDPGHLGSGLGYSRSIALAQFLRNENRLKRDSPLHEQYVSVIQEYSDLGHMTEVPPSHDSNNYYLPHHAVIKPDSTTTKLRVVFNASSPSANGTSLNDLLHAGPVLQSDLTLQILKWRYFRYAFNADITKMYRQIWVDPEHTRFQRILFRNAEGEIRDYELKTVTFGVNCAPFLAIRVLQQLSNDVQSQFPRASHIIRHFMYVDDVLAGADSTQEAQLAIRELQAALSSAGFPLRKWTANHKDVLAEIPSDHLLHTDFLEIDAQSTAKTLGIRWKATSDEFFFVPPVLSLESSYTKREVLSQIAKLFDPAGWLAPFIVRSKIFMQEIWLQELEWDENLPNELCQYWQAFLRSYSCLTKIRIPRWIGSQPSVKVEHHGFCDASEKAYGAAIYVRVEMGQRIDVHLLAAKTRVAPVKTVSLPRLELCGAVLLAEMATAILPSMPTTGSTCYYWTDSTIVLAWLNKPACHWTTFVANRVTKIAQTTETQKWSHVRSEHNPADLASRGVPLQDLVDNHLWWHGPSWLQQPRSQWPLQDQETPVIDLEQRAVKVHFTTSPPEDFLERFSTLEKALRVRAYVLRFLQRCRKLPYAQEIHPTSGEINEAERTLILETQRREYSQEYHSLREKRPVPRSSSILNLNPFMDQHGVIRSCGRVSTAQGLKYDERHPIILPYNCRLSRLLTQFTHRITLHGGSQLMVRLIRSKYWIPRIQKLMKGVVNSCKVCLIHKRKLQTQLMGDLPRERTSFSRPFTHTGIDYAGPFEIRNYTGRACLITKGYVCVFVCFSTKAIHLEPTSDLTTEKFLAAFARFVARRGCPQSIHSDNGKTFVGAATVLARDFLEAFKDSVIDAYSHQRVSWKFIPPGAPHMGGLWEAGVKSFKTLFYKATSTRRYTFEELSTLLSKIEACLNSRPLSPMSEDPTELLALTPGHFLTGGTLNGDGGARS
ncbi:uncharacterized protein LOC121404212 [Drosophila obscura]|uniref:uncharacterized protein LOC121404212 n=1 Tax=Drosophila obscura TaxID=7282 RepID=UPI001BB12BBE|nr:uncharacterized protein LOC121404212 [Drosophila obscura]